MQSLNLKIALLAATSRMRPFRQVTNSLHELSSLKGSAWWFGVPGTIATIADAFLDPNDYGLWGHFQNSWVTDQGGGLLVDWFITELRRDQGYTNPLTLQQSAISKITLYQKVGLVVREHEHRGCSYLRDPLNPFFQGWFKDRMSKVLGDSCAVVRFVAPDRSGRESGRAIRDSHGEMESTSSKWSLELSAPPHRDSILRGAWAPSVEEVERAISGGRTILFFGPPGTGKTGTAIRAASNGRTIVIPGSSFNQGTCSGRAAASIVSVLQADVLVVDDLSADVMVQHLEEFEVLNRRGVSVVVTVMTDGRLPRLPGLRPGRIDEMFAFQVPDVEGQKALLEFYAPTLRWSTIGGHPKMKGMTPAYLRELARRVSSGEDVERALTSLALQIAIAT